MGYFSNTSKTYTSKGSFSIPQIRKLGEHKHKFSIKPFITNSGREHMGLQYVQVFGFSAITHTPALQRMYAQGSPENGALTWHGPETNEMFSWGPKVSLLEYDGSAYPYDMHGKLVAQGIGNGTTAKAYSKSGFFNKGFVANQDLFFHKQLSSGINIVGVLKYAYQSGVLRNTEKNNKTAHLNVDDIKLSSRSTLQFQSMYNRTYGTLTSHGGNISRIVGDLWSAPPTFDPTNGRSPKQALQHSDSYLLEDGSNRSFAPQGANNPYGLVATSPDYDKHTQYQAGLTYNFLFDSDYHNVWKVSATSSYHYQDLDSRFGIPPLYAGSENGMLSIRADQKEQVDFRLIPSYKYESYNNWAMEFMMDYAFSSISRTFKRQNGTDFSASGNFSLSNAGTRSEVQNDASRYSHRLTSIYKISYSDHYRLHLGNTSYFSNTLDQKGFQNFFPFISARGDIDFYGGTVSPKISYAASAHEADLMYNDWAYASTRTTSGNFRSSYESSELFFHSALRPELVSKLEVGSDLELYVGNRFLFSFYYNKKTIEDYMLPIYRDGQFMLDNVGNVSDHSIRFSMEYGNVYWREWNWNIALKWMKSAPKVTGVKQQNNEVIAISGFSNAFSAFADGQPLGMIYGTYYERNAAGERLIADDGFPYAAGDVKPLANPNPDWVLGLDGRVGWRQLSFSFIMELLYGGQVWNGTAAYLDYLGASSKTARQRATKDYVFKGVNENGNENTIAVDFLDPGKPIEESRWVRYGPEGVAEDYIEDATSFRISEMALTYTLTFRHWKKMSFTVIGHNLLQVTPYSGVDPADPLMDYTSGRGLDLFNTPSTKSYQLKISVKL